MGFEVSKNWFRFPFFHRLMNLGKHFNFLVGFFGCFFLAALGLRCYVSAFSSHGEWGLLLVAVHRLLTAVASLVAE